MISKNENLRLKIGNLILAIWLSTIPTGITYGTLGLNGLNVCRSLDSSMKGEYKELIKRSCDEAAWSAPKSYIFLIGFFITLPTWLWFYLSMKRKKEK